MARLSTASEIKDIQSIGHLLNPLCAKIGFNCHNQIEIKFKGFLFKDKLFEV